MKHAPCCSLLCPGLQQRYLTVGASHTADEAPALAHGALYGGQESFAKPPKYLYGAHIKQWLDGDAVDRARIQGYYGE